MDDRSVDAAQAPPRQDSERKGRNAKNGKGTADAEELDGERGDERSDRDCDCCETLERAEDAREQLVGYEPRGQREQANIDESVPHTDQAHQDEDRRLIRKGAAEAERQAPQRDSDALDSREASAANDHQCPERTGDGASPHGGRHQPHPGLASVEELEGHHNEEDVETPTGEGLGQGEADEQAGITITPEAMEAGGHLDADPSQLQWGPVMRSVVRKVDQQRAGTE